MTIAMQLLKAHEQLMQLMSQNQINSCNKELPQEMQQLLDNQTHIVRMMWQIRTNSNDEATPTAMGNQESKESTWIKPVACKTCGEIGHTSNECHDEWPHCAARHQTKGCFTTQITCFLCEATNHIPTQCQLYPIVQ